MNYIGKVKNCARRRVLSAYGREGTNIIYCCMGHGIKEVIQWNLLHLSRWSGSTALGMP